MKPPSMFRMDGPPSIGESEFRTGGIRSSPASHPAMHGDPSAKTRTA